MEVNALQQMLSRLKQVQEDLQRQVNAVAVEASAGGGMVIVRMNGQKQLVDVRIEPDVFASKDQEMLQDLIRAAVNEASRRVDEELSNQMKNLSGNIPGIVRPENPRPLLNSPPLSINFATRNRSISRIRIDKYPFIVASTPTICAESCAYATHHSCLILPPPSND